MRLFQTNLGVARDRGDALELLALPSLHELIVSGDLGKTADAPATAVVGADAVVFGPPVQPKRLIQVGLNFHSHLAEVGRPVPERPIYAITPVTDQVVGDNSTIRFPDDDQDDVDHECEIAVVVGRSTQGVAADSAWSHIAGVTACNDVSARKLQRQGLARGELSAGKMLTGFKPLGPGLILADEARSSSLTLTLTVNGDVRQSADRSDMVFSIERLIEIISADVALEPGDVIMTGSPAGVGFFSGRLLRDGDVTEIKLGDLPPLRTRFTKD